MTPRLGTRFLSRRTGSSSPTKAFSAGGVVVGVVEGVTTPRLGTRFLSGRTVHLSQTKVFTGGGRRGGHDPKIGNPAS